MKITIVVVRVLMGLMFLMAAGTYFLKLAPTPTLQGGAKDFMVGVAASIYLMPLIKLVELICGLAFVAGRYVALATVVIFPVTINILLYHAYLGPKDILIPVLLLIANLFLAFAYRKHYSGLFVARRIEKPQF